MLPYSVLLKACGVDDSDDIMGDDCRVESGGLQMDRVYGVDGYIFEYDSVRRPPGS